MGWDPYYRSPYPNGGSSAQGYDPTNPYGSSPFWNNPPANGADRGVGTGGGGIPLDSSQSSSSASSAASSSIEVASPTTAAVPYAGVGTSATISISPSSSTAAATAAAAAKSSSAYPPPSHEPGFLGNEGRAAEASSSGLSHGTLFAAIFIPIIAVSLICSLCLICFLRRRRRLNKLANPNLKELPQESVDQIYSARSSRSLPSFGPGADLNRYSTASDPSASHHGPLITVDGPSYSHARDEASPPPPPYKTGSSSPSSPTDPTSPTRPLSGPLSDASMALHHSHEPSPFADPHDDNISEILDPGHCHHHRKPTDADQISIVSAMSDFPRRSPTNPRREF